MKKGDKIEIAEKKEDKKILENLTETLKKKTLPSWLSFDTDKHEGQLTNLPSIEEVAPPAEISLIFEFYSK
jgi:ribosomal protein S4